MTPEEAIAKLKTLPEEKQRAVLLQLSPEERKGILGKLHAPKSASPQFSTFPPGEMRAGPKSNLPAEGSVGQRFGLGPGGYIEAGRQGAEKWMERNAPIVMGTVGAAAGGIPGAVVGGALAGAATDPEHPGRTAAEQGITQGLYEVGGKLLGKATGKLLAPIGERLAPRLAPYLAKYPFLKGLLGIAEEKTSPKAAQYLTRAASTKESAGQVVEEIGHTLEDIEQEITKLPVEKRTVGGFLSAVNSRKSAMNLEYEAALTPVAKVRIMPTGVAEKIKSLIKPYMNQAEYTSEKDAIEAAAKDFEHGWSLDELDSLRTKLGSELSRHKAKESVSRYVAEKGNVNLAIDNAIQDGLRDTVYPMMDQVAGKPAGYFEDMKARQSSLITLQRVLNKRAKDLSGAQAVSEATSRFSTENASIYLHPSGEPRGYIHGITKAIAPPREMKQASKMVKKAFPRSIDTQPYEILFGTAGRVFGPAPPGNLTDRWANQGPQ